MSKETNAMSKETNDMSNMWHVYMTHLYVRWLIHMWHGSFIRDMTRPYVTWLIHMWHDSFICDTTHSYVTWLVSIWHDDMTHLDVTWLMSHDSHTGSTTARQEFWRGLGCSSNQHLYTGFICDKAHSQLTAFMHDMTHSQLSYTIWLIHGLHTWSTDGGDRTWNNCDCWNSQQDFTGVPLHIWQVFTGVPKLSNEFSSE